MTDELSLPHAVALGLVQGVTEPLPVSSSAHVSLAPWLLRWPEASLPRERRKEIELALHAGSTLASLRPASLRQLTMLTLGAAPAGLAGLMLERAITRRLSAPIVTATGQIGGVLVMALARRRRGQRRAADARRSDALAIGLAQMVALVPGISRSGATLAAAHARGFAGEDARILSEIVGAPVLLGASLLGVGRTARAHPVWRRSLAAGAVTAAATTPIVRRAIGRGQHDRAPLALATYRVAVALLTIRRLRDNGRAMESAA